MITRNDLRHAFYQSVGGLLGLIGLVGWLWYITGNFGVTWLALMPAVFGAHLAKGGGTIERWRFENPDVNLYDACFGPSEAAPEARAEEDEEDA